MKNLVYFMLTVVFATNFANASMIDDASSHLSANAFLQLEFIPHTNKQVAGVYWLPDYLGNNASRVNDGGKKTVTCADKSKVTCVLPFQGVGTPEVVDGKNCYASCTCKNVSNCTSAFNLSSPPANAIYSSCNEVNSGCVNSGNRYKIDSCKQGYVLSGSSCAVRTCPSGFTAGLTQATCPNTTDDYTTDGYSGAQVCGKCTNTCSADYKYDSCPVGANCGEACGGKFKVESCQTAEGYELSGETCVAKPCPAGFTAGVDRCNDSSDVYSKDGKSGGKVCGRCVSGCNLDGYTITTSSAADSTCGTKGYDTKTCNSVTKYKCLGCFEAISKRSEYAVVNDEAALLKATASDLWVYDPGTNIVLTNNVTTNKHLNFFGEVYSPKYLGFAIKSCASESGTYKITAPSAMFYDDGAYFSYLANFDIGEVSLEYQHSFGEDVHFGTINEGGYELYLSGETKVDHQTSAPNYVIISANSNIKTEDNFLGRTLILGNKSCITDGNGYKICAIDGAEIYPIGGNNAHLPNYCGADYEFGELYNVGSQCDFGNITSNCPAGSYAYIESCPNGESPSPVNTTDGIAGICKSCVNMCEMGIKAKNPEILFIKTEDDLKRVDMSYDFTEAVILKDITITKSIDPITAVRIYGPKYFKDIEGCNRDVTINIGTVLAIDSEVNLYNVNILGGRVEVGKIYNYIENSSVTNTSFHANCSQGAELSFSKTKLTNVKFCNGNSDSACNIRNQTATDSSNLNEQCPEPCYAESYSTTGCYFDSGMPGGGDYVQDIDCSCTCSHVTSTTFYAAGCSVTPYEACSQYCEWNN